MNAGHSAQPATPIRAAWNRSARPIASSTLCSESCSTSTWTISAAKDNGIRRSGLARHELIRQFKRGAPFNLFEMLALFAELLADVIETCARRAALMFRGLAIDDDTPRGESRPQRQASDANERCLKAVGQSKSKLHSLFTVALESRWTIIVVNDIASSWPRSRNEPTELSDWAVVTVATSAAPSQSLF